MDCVIQLEYLLFEQGVPGPGGRRCKPGCGERLRDRLIEGYAIYTLTPALVLLLTLLRVVRELGGTTQQVIEPRC